MRQRSQFDKYMPVKGFNECKMYSEGIAYWEDDYPKNGINFKLWDQHEKKGDTVCVGGIYNEMANTCFTYDTIKKICMLVKFTKDHETNSYSWVYTGGCFEGGKAVLYKPAEVGERHQFKQIKFEVRVDQRADAEAETAEPEDISDDEVEDGVPH